MAKFSRRFNSLVFIVAITALLIGSMATPARSFSENENRVLKQRPAFSWEKLVSGKYTLEMEEFITEQFFLRDVWIGIKSNMERFMMKQENNNVYFGRNGYLFEKFKEDDKKRLDLHITRIKDFIEKNEHIPSYVLLPPTAVRIYPENVPPFSVSVDQEKLFAYIKEQFGSDVSLIDVYDILLNNKNDYIYYRTDHHWTHLGAWYGYQKLAAVIGFTPLGREAFDIETVSKDFRGTLYSKSGYWNIRPDTMEILFPKDARSITVSYNKGKATNYLYDMSYLQKKDKYSVFMGGNHALVKIETGVENGKKLLVIKDSFANNFIPFLVDHYSEIHVIDLRHYNLGVSDYVAANDINEMLLMYNIKSMCQETSIAKLR